MYHGTHFSKKYKMEETVFVNTDALAPREAILQFGQEKEKSVLRIMHVCEYKSIVTGRRAGYFLNVGSTCRLYNSQRSRR
jgi:hypothetical protein